MNIYKSSLFKYIAGDSLIGKAVPMTMARVVNEDVTGENGTAEKQILYFVESKKGMVLNKTNAKRIARLYGPETDEWKGKVIELYTEPVKAFGETHNAIRVREAKAQAQANKIKAETLTAEQRKARRADNPLRIVEEAPIGENGFNPDWEVFVARVIDAIPFFTNEAQVKAALDLLDLTYSPETEQLCYAELAESAGREADLKAA